MNIRMLAATALIVIPLPAFAETETECRARWQAADVDGNGSLEANVDAPDYVKTLNSKAPVSRDDFLKQCKGGAFAGLPKPNNPAENKDLGKGDITPGPALNKDDALKKLKASGFGNVTDLKVDSKGVWRGTGVANGKNVNVAVDPQGDIVAN